MKTNAGSTLYGHDGAYSRENVNTRERAKVHSSSCTAMNAHDHRCADCGQRVYALELREGRAVLAHCSDTVLCFSWAVQAAALALCQRAVQEFALPAGEKAGMKHLDMAIATATDEVAALTVPTRKGNSTLVVLDLLRAWRGIPERYQFPATEPPQAPANVPSLY